MSVLSRSGEPARACADCDDETAQLFLRHASALSPASQELMKRLFAEVAVLDAAGDHQDAQNLIQRVEAALKQGRT